jgi:hypothetical protein
MPFRLAKDFGHFNEVFLHAGEIDPGSQTTVFGDEIVAFLCEL